MAIVQFRIHPGVGCARFGNSSKAYHLASEFPYFLQEEFPNLRFKPNPRTHPRSFFPNDTDPDATGGLAGYNIYEDRAFENLFKEAEGKIFPQGVRFRVFAYVYDDDVTRRRPLSVFEVTADMADITWKVDIANKKAHVGGAPDENAATADLTTSPPPPVPLLCKRVRRDATVPNLAYIFLERDDADKNKVTGRLHVIGNEGGFVGSTSPSSLWSDDWYDSAGDGPVQAVISPKGDSLRNAAGVGNIADLKYFDYGTDPPQPGTTANINAMPAWVVIGPPDYVPDMGFFVSLWDIAVDRAFRSLETSSVINQPGKHKLIRWKSQFNSYRKTDYLIHIHPHLCLFDDVKFVSGEASGDPETAGIVPVPVPIQAHNIHPATPPPAPDPDPKKTEKATIAHGGILFNPRALKSRLQDPKDLKDPDPSKPIVEWMKRAVYGRLRKPGTLYDKTRKFLILSPGDPNPDGTRKPGTFPRKLGRRLDYDRAAGGDKNVMYEFPGYKAHNGNLREYHGLPHAGRLCGGANSPPAAGPPTRPPLSATELELLQFIDDMYWPATFSDMPMLRELAYTTLQYSQFEAWQASDADVRMDNIFDVMLSPALKASFMAPGRDADQHFADFLAARPLFAPAVIDMAAAGAMLGGSFLPGIEVGREAGVAANWCVFYGATQYFPTIRFKPVRKAGEHTHGTLTKDLAVPWSEDFKACDEKFWPTSRPGRTIRAAAGPRENWQITDADPIPHLGRVAGSAEEFVKEYWKSLGFMRRTAANEFIEQEQTWH